MTDAQFDHLLQLLSSASVVLTFALGYIGGYTQ